MQKPSRVFLGLLGAALLVLPTTLLAQSEFKLTFKGTAYERDASGNLVPTPITEKTWLDEAPNSTGMVVVYHVNGNSEFGDTIDIVDPKTGVAGRTVFGLFYGEYDRYGRFALTNAAATEVRRIDYLYTDQSPASVGSAFVTKRYLTDTNGVRRLVVDGHLHWLFWPKSGHGPRVCTGTFNTGEPVF